MGCELNRAIKTPISRITHTLLAVVTLALLRSHRHNYADGELGSPHPPQKEDSSKRV